MLWVVAAVVVARVEEMAGMVVVMEVVHQEAVEAMVGVAVVEDTAVEEARPVLADTVINHTTRSSNSNKAVDGTRTEEAGLNSSLTHMDDTPATQHHLPQMIPTLHPLLLPKTMPHLPLHPTSTQEDNQQHSNTLTRNHRKGTVTHRPLALLNHVIVPQQQQLQPPSHQKKKPSTNTGKNTSNGRTASERTTIEHQQKKRVGKTFLRNTASKSCFISASRVTHVLVSNTDPSHNPTNNTAHSRSSYNRKSMFE